MWLTTLPLSCAECLWKSGSLNLLKPSGPQPGLLQDCFTCTLKTSWYYSWFQAFAMFCMLYAFFWVIPRHLEFICRRFGTLCLFHLHRQVDVPMKMEQSVLKRRHINSRCRVITQTKSYNSWYYITKCITASSFHFSGWSTYLFLPFCFSFLTCCKSFSRHPCIELEHWTFILLGWSLVLCHVLTNIKFWALKSNLIKVCICLYFSQCIFVLHLCQSVISFLLFSLRSIILFIMNSEISTQYRFLVTKRRVIR